MDRIRWSALVAALLCGVALSLEACATTRTEAANANSVGALVPADSLSAFGKFETLDNETAAPGLQITDSGQALGNARDADFGRAEVPEASLVRVLDTDDGLLPLAKGSVVWVFRWAGLKENEHKAFPGEDGAPNETVFLYTEYFLFVDAQSGDPIAGVRH